MAFRSPDLPASRTMIRSRHGSLPSGARSPDQLRPVKSVTQCLLDCHFRYSCPMLAVRLARTRNARIGHPARARNLPVVAALAIACPTTVRPIIVSYSVRQRPDEIMPYGCGCGRSHPPRVAFGFIVAGEIFLSLHERALNQIRLPGKTMAISRPSVRLGHIAYVASPTRPWPLLHVIESIQKRHGARLCPNRWAR